MAQTVTITFTDNGDESVHVSMHFEPPVSPDFRMTPATLAALDVFERLTKNNSEDKGVCHG